MTLPVEVAGPGPGTASADPAVASVDPGAGAGALDRATVRRIALFLVAIAVLLAVRSWVVAPTRVSSDSMAPTLTPGRMILVDKLSLRWRGPRAGEIVTTVDPLTGAPIVKRVVAVAGDDVGIEDGVLVVNGVAVPDPHADQATMEGDYFGPVPVPAGHVFLLGDRRGESVDSRRFGPVPVASIDGRLLLALWG